MKTGNLLLSAVLLSAGCLLASAPSVRTGVAYQAERVALLNEGVRPVLVGEVVYADDFDAPGVWTTQNYNNALTVAGVGRKPGVKGLCLAGATNVCDTAWRHASKLLPLTKKGKSFAITFEVKSDQNFFDPGKAQLGFCNAIRWFDAAGKEIAAAALSYSVGASKDFVSVRVDGSIPAGAEQFAVNIGFDSPNLKVGDTVNFRHFVFSVMDDRPVCARTASFVSEVRTGGRIAWEAQTPPGTAVGLRWRGADTPTALFELPFLGPDGTEKSVFTAPFVADKSFVQYQAVFSSDGAAVPTLTRVYTADWSESRWLARGDGQPPHVAVASATPTKNAHEVLRLKVEDSSAVDWSTLTTKVDGVSAAFTREGPDGLVLAGRAEPWATGVHTVDVSVADCHGNFVKSRKFFFVGEKSTTPVYTLRDDGVVLVDGRPFFPIGPYAVCRREFNGNDFDRAFRDLKAGGFNFAHTYGNSYDPEFLASAKKYGFKLWVRARFPDANFLTVGRHHPSILAWYLGDDTASHIRPEEERDYHDACKAVDPTRLTCQADPIASDQILSRYADYVNATDVFMPEIYPVRKEKGDKTDDTCVAETIRDMKRCYSDVATYGDGTPRSCWPIIQYFKGWGSWGHFPTKAQLDAMTWAAVVHGAHGMTWYTYGGFVDKKKNRVNEGITSTPERWRNICELATHLKELADVLTERKGPQPPVPAIVAGEKLDPLGQPAVTCLLKKHAGKAYLIAVNASPKPATARFALPGVTTAVETLWENGRTLAAKDGFEDGFAGFGVHVYCWRAE